MAQRQANAIAAIEAASLSFQHRLLLHEIGTCIPSMICPNEIHRVLNVACGPGVWMIELGQSYPQMKLTGIDSASSMIRIARENAYANRRANLTFEVQDYREPLPFGDRTFDFVYVSPSSWTITPQMWPYLLDEILRTLRPGGWINLVDLEFGPFSNAAIASFITDLRAMLAKAGCIISPEGLSLTSALIYPQLLWKAGYNSVQYTLYPLDLGNQTHAPYSQEAIIAMLANDKRFLSLARQVDAATQEQMKILMDSMLEEARDFGHCGLGLLISVVAKKPI
jgi:SAM-dependent methyltransferase